MRLDMAQVGLEAGLSDQLFILREKGEHVYHLLRLALQNTADGRPLILVFPPHQLLDASFADESIVRLAQELVSGEFEHRCILLQGLGKDSLHNIASAISLQNLKLALLAVEDSGEWQCVGRLEPSLRETLGMLARRGKLTAPELARLRGLAVNTASNRLKRLYDQRLVRREHEVSEKGLQYIYHFWNWTSEDSPHDQVP